MAHCDKSESTPSREGQEREEHRVDEENKVLLRKHGGASTHGQYLDHDRARKRSGNEDQSR